MADSWTVKEEVLLERRKKLEKVRYLMRRCARERRNRWLFRGGSAQIESSVVDVRVPSSESEGTSIQRMDKRPRHSEDADQNLPKKKKMKQLTLFPVDKKEL